MSINPTSRDFDMSEYIDLGTEIVEQSNKDYYSRVKTNNSVNGNTIYKYLSGLPVIHR